MKTKVKVFDYRGLEMFGKPASDLREISDKSQNVQRRVESFDRCAFETMQRDYDLGLDWEAVKGLLDLGFDLGQAKELVRNETGA